MVYFLLVFFPLDRKFLHRVVKKRSGYNQGLGSMPLQREGVDFSIWFFPDSLALYFSLWGHFTLFQFSSR